MSDDIAKKIGMSLSGPGPADYFLPSTIGHRNHDISKSRGPSFSMGVRLPGLFCDSRVKSESPGPKYQVEYLTKYGKSDVPSNVAAERIRSKSCKLFGDTRRNRSFERSSSCRNSDREFPGERTDTIMKKVSEAKSYDSRKTTKIIESRTLNNDLKSFYAESQSKPMNNRPRIHSAKYGDASRRF
ncbi:hypothetical protein WA026_018529 [Henosepilachna vigintioctopunctata]|uniref:Uncharacterized protein n=1 Tax=Henosepilachna vigintioctopunctata TaxID=420089 RepID=A0AAW1U9P6_9CUCU